MKQRAVFPQDIHQLFEEQAARTPEAVAVVCEGHQLTYGNLNARANQLSHHLRGIGVAGALMGICVERSLEMVVGLLGILKGRRGVCAAGSGIPQERSRVHGGRLPDSGAADTRRMTQLFRLNGESMPCLIWIRPGPLVRRAAGERPGQRAGWDSRPKAWSM